jgi:hypothetical protein
MAEGHEVHTKFVLDDHASHALEHLKESFEGVHERVEKVQEGVSEFKHELLGVGVGAIGTALGLELGGLIETVKSAGEEIFHAATGLEEQEKAIRGILMVTDKEGTSLEELSSHAHEINEEFATMGIEIGTSKESLISAFDEMAERTGLATDDVMKLTGSMAEAGRAIPGGIGSLSTGFSNLSAGMIRAKNPIVQLVAATGLLHGNAKAVALQMQKMSPQQAMELGIKAVQRMGEKMKDVPMSFNETLASMTGLREELYETVGTPMLQAIQGPLGQLRDYFMENREEINKWAKSVGHDAGEWFKQGAHEIAVGFQYLEAHSAEIKTDIMEAMHFVRSTVEFLIAHKDAIVWGLRAQTAASLAPGVMNAAGTAKAAGTVALGFGSKLAGMSFGGEAAAGAAAAGIAARTAATAAAGGGAAAAATAGAEVGAAGTVAAAGATTAAAALGVFAVAAASVGSAVYQGVQLWDVAVTHNGVQLEAAARKREAERAAIAGEVEETDLMIKALYNAGQANDAYLESLRETVDVAYGAKRANMDLAEFKKLDAIAQKTKVLQAEDTNRSTKDLLFGPGSLRAELAAANAYAKTHPEKKEGGEIKVPPQLNFTGPITIHQDFKNDDPERIALIFRKDLAKSALAKTTAATTVPHTAF